MSSPPSDNPASALLHPLLDHPGIGAARARKLEKLGLRTVADLLFFFPRTYHDFRRLDRIADLAAEQEAQIVGTVLDLDTQITSTGKQILHVLVQQDSETLRCTWFNQSFLRDRFAIGQAVVVRGKAKLQGGQFQMTHPRVIWLTDDQPLESLTRLTPVYPLTEGIHQSQMRTWVATAVERAAGLVEEAFPPRLREELDLCGIDEAIVQIHAPPDWEAVERARSRLVFQELLVLQLALALARHHVQQSSRSPQLELTAKIRSRILGRLPFELTPSQQQAWQEIADDLHRPWPMNRLIHGEVGSGKTVVALCAMLTCVAHGYQAALMAPTEILAQQHFRTLSGLLQGSRVRLALWSGSQTAAQRKQLAAAIAAGDVDLVIGTQAVVASQLEFHRLGLAVVDEQHKFGVRQRAHLKQSEHDPHYLVMTATPIPRTVAMTLFGDLDISVLARSTGLGERVHTYLGQESTRASWWEFVAKKLREGRQAYVVAPRVEGDADSGSAHSAEQQFEALSNGPLAEFRLDLLHGRQSPAEKEAAMQAFAQGQTQVLVATGVVEVGIDVPNATVMTIESAERFGLSQLHQLRGRVSRGRHVGYVCVFATDDSPETNERLQAFEQTSDGFELAEIDLRIRGPGNLFSTEQSGFPPFRIADLIRDREVLEQAQSVARQLVAADPELSQPEMQRLRQLVQARYGAALELGDVG